ncbi:CYFA0S29e01024g1_1 [Cyberlindnera fabianii]|uniref:CYFA0S29e01024g1_1 n=1 Tax=Cyberlindnera fabianii TaxID=36022 RepID=A0A061BB37_CYBFA|nr:CYFA0S29e01024g1_1 [Cyberlindnera fabianii]
MVARRSMCTVLLSLIAVVLILSVVGVQNNHHKRAMDYLEKMMRLKILQILYPEQHFTVSNYTDFRFLDPIANEVFDKFKVLEADPNYVRENATLFSLVRNEELYLMLQSIRYVEDRFNKRYHYDWIFANDKNFTDEFKVEVGNLVSGNATFVTIPQEYWSYPSFIDQNKAEQTRNYMKKEGIKYGGSESYRFMCRFNSGFFYKLEEMQNYRYYWRVEPDIKFECDFLEDPFRFMRENNIKYGFAMALHELHNTVYGLFEATKDFFQNIHPDWISKDNHIEYVTQDNQETFNMCHYWSNFEIGDLEFYRSQQYEEYFQHLEKLGGFFYERWGDAPIHTFAVSYLLNKSEVHYFDNTGYYHIPHTQCPRSADIREERRCTCQIAGDYNWGSRDSCLPYWYETHDGQRPPWAPGRRYDTQKAGAKRPERVGKRSYQEEDADETLLVETEIEDVELSGDMLGMSDGAPIRQAFAI